jgi:hypothetical protein
MLLEESVAMTYFISYLDSKLFSLNDFGTVPAGFAPADSHKAASALHTPPPGSGESPV